jgi:hypothetical protein
MGILPVQFNGLQHCLVADVLNFLEDPLLKVSEALHIYLGSGVQNSSPVRSVSGQRPKGNICRPHSLSNATHGSTLILGSVLVFPQETDVVARYSRQYLPRAFFVAYPTKARRDAALAIVGATGKALLVGMQCGAGRCQGQQTATASTEGYT